MKNTLSVYEAEGSVMFNELVKAEWAVATDSNSEEKQAALQAAVLKSNVFTRDYYDKYFKGVKPEDFDDELTQRQLKYLVHLGRDALITEDLSNVSFKFEIFKVNMLINYEIIISSLQQHKLAWKEFITMPEFVHLLNKIAILLKKA